MRIIESVSELEALYDVTVQGAIDKVCDHITPLYRRWIDASRFVILSTVGPDQDPPWTKSQIAMRQSSGGTAA